MTALESPQPLSMYELDETGWLDQTARLVVEGRLAEVDSDSLSEYLTDMARRDRREIERRLFLYIAHILKWEYQPEKRSPSWRQTIRSQRREILSLIDSATLRRHAEAELGEIFREACEFAAEETDIEISCFPKQNGRSLTEWLAFQAT